MYLTVAWLFCLWTLLTWSDCLGWLAAIWPWHYANMYSFLKKLQHLAGDLVWRMSGWEKYTLVTHPEYLHKINHTDLLLSYYTGVLGQRSLPNHLRFAFKNLPDCSSTPPIQCYLPPPSRHARSHRIRWLFQPCLVRKNFQDSLSHQIFGRMHGALNIDKNKN